MLISSSTGKPMMREVCWPTEPRPKRGDSNTRPWPRSNRCSIAGFSPSRYVIAFSSQRNALRSRASISWKPSTSARSCVDCRAASYCVRSSSSSEACCDIAIAPVVSGRPGIISGGTRARARRASSSASRPTRPLGRTKARCGNGSLCARLRARRRTPCRDRAP